MGSWFWKHVHKTNKEINMKTDLKTDLKDDIKKIDQRNTEETKLSFSEKWKAIFKSSAEIKSLLKEIEECKEKGNKIYK